MGEKASEQTDLKVVSLRRAGMETVVSRTCQPKGRLLRFSKAKIMAIDFQNTLRPESPSLSRSALNFSAMMPRIDTELSKLAYSSSRGLGGLSVGESTENFYIPDDKRRDQG